MVQIQVTSLTDHMSKTGITRPRASTIQGFFLEKGEAVWGIAYIMQSLHKFIVSLFCLISRAMGAALCNYLWKPCRAGGRSVTVSEI